MKQLPMMWNVLSVLGMIMVFFLLILVVELFNPEIMGEAAWGLVGIIVGIGSSAIGFIGAIQKKLYGVTDSDE